MRIPITIHAIAISVLVVLMMSSLTLAEPGGSATTPSVQSAAPSAASPSSDTPVKLPLEEVVKASQAEYESSSGLQKEYLRNKEQFAAEIRRSFIVPAFRALKILIDNRAPDENSRPPYPDLAGAGVPNFNPPFGPRYEAAKKRYEAGLEAKRTHLLLEALWGYRMVVTANIAAYYADPPDATEELRQLATDILKDTAVVDALMAKVEKIKAERQAVTVLVGPPPPAPKP